jgi:hypothetical protein
MIVALGIVLVMMIVVGFGPRGQTFAHRPAVGGYVDWASLFASHYELLRVPPPARLKEVTNPYDSQSSPSKSTLSTSSWTWS